MIKKTINKNEYDLNELKIYRALPAKDKLHFLEQMNAFFQKAMPSRSKKAWEKLKQKGW